MKSFSCACGAPLFFDNTLCLNCNSPVGYEPGGDVMVRLVKGSAWQLCANGAGHGVCNWVIPATAPGGLCKACGLNRIIPDLTVPGNMSLWAKLERAKRRSIYWLSRRRLPVQSKVEAMETGMAIEIMRPLPNQPVVTGHAQGVLTLNLEEADDVAREANRNRLGEPYRTLLGHFRHEISHYYWWLWFEKGGAPSNWLPAVRQVFGDESADYAAALRAHYQNGSPAGWSATHISAYATCHPWEDWAETWAHYAHVTDALETAKACRLACKATTGSRWPLRGGDINLPAPFQRETGRAFLEIMQDWMALAPALNEMSLSLGHQDLYPFSPTAAVVRKLHLIHVLITAAARR